MGLEKIIEKKKEAVRERIEEELEKVKGLIKKKRYPLRIPGIKNIAVLIDPLNSNEILVKSTINLAKRLRASLCICALALENEDVANIQNKLSLFIKQFEDAGISVEKSEVISVASQEAVKAFLDWAKNNQCQLIVAAKKYRIVEEQREYSWFAEEVVEINQEIPIIFTDKEEITEEHLNRALVLVSFRELKFPNVEIALSICGEDGEIYLLTVIESSEVISLAKSMELSQEEAIAKIKDKRLNNIKNLSESIKSIMNVDVKEHIEVGEVASIATEYQSKLKPVITYVNRSVRPGEIGTHLLLLLKSLDPIVVTPMI